MKKLDPDAASEVASETSDVRKLLRPVKKSFWGGAAMGLLAHYLAVAVSVVLFTFLRPFVWLALHDDPYVPASGAVDPSSGEGTLLQFIGMLSWVPAGLAAMHWGGTGGLRSALALLGYLAFFTAVALTQDVPSMSPGRALWYWLCSPLGLALGVALYGHRRARVAAAKIEGQV